MLRKFLSAFSLGWRSKRSSSVPLTEAWPLGLQILDWTKTEPFTLEDACKGIQVWGCTGSGKSSGSGQLLALSYLRKGFGGLVLAAKPAEADTWREYCHRAGRSDDLIVFSPQSDWRFNFL